MKILIDIPEETYNKMRRSEALYPADANVAIFAIETGTPLGGREDAISRQAVIDMTGLSEWFDSSDNYNKFVFALSELPPVIPQYTEAEIQRMQELEQAEIQKAYEIGRAENIEVLDKIRAEIKQMPTISFNANDIYKADVLAILDKYKASQTGAESEG